MRPGEVLACNGCHVRTATNPKSHGRTGSFASIYNGSSGGVFPATDPAIVANSGETMAQTRSRLSCALNGPDRCKSILPSVDVVFDDAWTDAVASGRAKDASLFSGEALYFAAESLTTPMVWVAARVSSR